MQWKLCFLNVTFVCELKDNIPTTIIKITVSENLTLTALHWTKICEDKLSTALPVSVWSGLSDIVMLVDR